MSLELYLLTSSSGSRPTQAGWSNAIYMLHLLTLVFTLVLHIQTAHAGGAGSVSNANDIDSITPAIINDTCTDYPEFKDQYGSCDDYVAKKWCESGTSGGGWVKVGARCPHV